MGAGSDDLVSVTGVAAGGACGSGALSAGFSRRNNKKNGQHIFLFACRNL
jgi:hypothetical protein